MKKWRRLFVLAQENDIPDQSSHHAVFTAIHKRYPDPKIDDDGEKLSINGHQVPRHYRENFIERVLHSLESRGVITAESWYKSCEAATQKIFAKLARQTRKRIERTVQIGYESALVLGHVQGEAFYSSREWRKLRLRAIEIHGRRCLCCGTSPEDGVRLHVDHIKPRSAYPELALDLANLQVLCEDCNIGKGASGEQDWRRDE